MSDHAICSHCQRATEFTDKESADDPNLVVECDQCGKSFDLYYANFLDVDELKSEFDTFVKRMIAQQHETGKIASATKRESQTWDLYWKHIGKVV